jgi:hypothetical protein
MAIANQKLSAYPFLEEMDQDDYFPKNLVEKGKLILLRLCEKIETEKPQSLDALYPLTHSATEQFNQLAAEFEQQDSEIETVAREIIAADFGAIAQAYGFEADTEELIAPRDW